MPIKNPTLIDHDLTLLSSFTHVLGLDEVGRGCIAGPMYAAGVLVTKDNIAKLKGKVADSKAISEKLRADAHAAIIADFEYFLAFKSAPQIDSEGLQQCNKAIFISIIEQALATGIKKEDLVVLIDGNLDFDLPAHFPQVICLIKGESKSVAIAAGSILAKVLRDSLITKMGVTYPKYDFEKNKGYGTPKHMEAVYTHGLSPEHRRSFLKQYVLEQLAKEPQGPVVIDPSSL